MFQEYPISPIRWKKYLNFQKIHQSIIMFGPVDSNYSNIYNKLLALVLGRYGVPHAELKVTE